VHENEQRQDENKRYDVVRQKTNEASRATHATILFALISDPEQNAAQ
jgi:hypothetical protein